MSLFPMLFNLFINDIFDGVTGLSVPCTNIRLPGLIFANDIVVFGNDIADLSHKVGQISRWAVENKMKISCGKSGVLVWGTDNSNESDRIIVSTDFGKIGEFTEYRYLGVLV